MQPEITVDAIIQMKDGIVLVNRKYPPYGWALPGGFIKYGESAEHAIIREVKEETGLDIGINKQFHTYSEPNRDPRRHIITIVFIARADGEPKAADDAADAKIFKISDLPYKIAFDHKKILRDYYNELSMFCEEKK